MSRFLSVVNIISGLLLFFLLAEIASWKPFETVGAKLVIFVMGIALMGNAIYFAFGSKSLNPRT